MNYYRARPELLSTDLRYLLAGAFAHNEQYNTYNELLPTAFKAEVCQRSSGAYFDSEIRANALMMNVLLDVDPSNKQVPQIIRYLTENGEKIWSTQDRSWAFLALGKAAARQGNSDVDVEVQADGKTLMTLANTQERVTLPAEAAGKRITLKGSGTGETYYFWQAEGVPVSGGPPSVDQNLSVRRQYLSRFGNPVDAFSQGDLIVCELTLTGGDRSVENIAVSDLLPAGFEIENPRIGGGADLAWVEEAEGRFSPDYLDLRDDRLLLFTDVQANKTKRYYYLIRAVNSGTFTLPAIGAEAMYDPAYRSYHGGGKIRVLR
jgi:uncharacterized protein YfaS (alpha-2-macroglobulin family)